MKKISLVVPVYNEEKNLVLLNQAISNSLKEFDYELIFVNDGSTDKSKLIVEQLKLKDEKVKLIDFYKNFGQTAAMDAGIKASQGDIIITLDADLQNDPADIPRMIKKLEEGYDVVCGWRYKRKDPFLKKITSKLANFIRKRLIKERIHDSGCTLKAFRKECFDNIDLYGEMHRYIPSFLRTRGFRITEVKVNHKKRIHGTTKYGSKRIVKGFLDLIMIYFWTNFASRPMHFFGTIGLITFIVGFISGLYLVIEKVFFGASLANRPLLLLVVLLVFIGVQFIIFGIIGEILMRVYYKVNKTKAYNIRKDKKDRIKY
jgi:glycosyltransferase involved in cell wall biosynthesis